VNGLPETAAHYDTWHGARITVREVTDFARENNLQLLALEGAGTQYMWITARKRKAPAPQPGPAVPVRIPRITNAHTSEPVAPCRGRFATVSLWVEGLPPESDLLDLEVTIGRATLSPFYVGAPEHNGLQQVNVMLPAALGTGLVPIQLCRLGQSLSRQTTIRVIPPGPLVPRVLSVTDAVDLLSGARIVSGYVKVILEEVEHPEEFEALVDNRSVSKIEIFCTDPVPPRFEINFALPEPIKNGPQWVEMRLGRRRFAPVAITVGSRDLPR
jgi:hypothetical protein